MVQKSGAWDNLRKVEFKAGDPLFKEGDGGFFFYIIQKGEVEVYKKDLDGQTRIIGKVGPGQPIGEFALVTKSTRSASARALTDGFAIEVSEDGYEKLLEELPEWTLAILESLINRLKAANELMAELQSQDIEDTESVIDAFSDDISK